MKTKNNVQKTILRTAAAIATLVLISITVSAQDFWSELLSKNSFREIAVAMVNYSGTGDKAENNDYYSGATYAALLTEVADPEISVENWMVSDYYDYSFNLLNEPENELKLEDWMQKEIFPNEVNLTAESETALKLEDWMLK